MLSYALPLGGPCRIAGYVPQQFLGREDAIDVEIMMNCVSRLPMRG